jgi:non-homologous end joining protein Ku
LHQCGTTRFLRGYEFSRDPLTSPFTPEELKALEEQSTEAIKVVEFVSIAKMCPVYFSAATLMEKLGQTAAALEDAMKRRNASIY